MDAALIGRSIKARIGDIKLTHTDFERLLEENPVIAAVKDNDGLEKALKTDVKIVFTLFGTVVNICEITEKIKCAGKLCMVHIDLVDGLASRESSIDFIRKYTGADGIISTKANLVRNAGFQGLLAIQRFFLLDSMAISNIEKQFPKDLACAAEVLPGLMPKIISKIVREVGVPLIASGLICDKEDVLGALSAGACAVSSTDPRVWNL